MGMTDFRVVLKLTVERRLQGIDSATAKHWPKMASMSGRIGKFAAQMVELHGIRQSGSRAVT
jgi:hypothetical protein